MLVVHLLLPHAQQACVTCQVSVESSVASLAQLQAGCCVAENSGI